MPLRLKDLPARTVLTLKTPIDALTASGTIVLEWESGFPGPYKQIDNSAQNDVFLTEIPLVIDANDPTSFEGFWLTGGQEMDGNQARYSITYRGVLNNLVATPTASYSVNFRAHKIGAICTIDASWLMSQQAVKYDEAAELANTFIYQARIFDTAQDVTVNDRLDVLIVPSEMDQFFFDAPEAVLDVAGTSGTVSFQIHNETQGVDILSSPLVVTSGNTRSSAFTINTSNRTVNAGDVLVVKCTTTMANEPTGAVLMFKLKNL